jgi:hypothetical protein
VRLWDYKDDDVIDQDTWRGYDYKPFIDSITARIAIHSSHQQRCENHVQLAALASKTNVGEKRRTWRAISISYLIRRFNQLSLNRMRSKESDLDEAMKDAKDFTPRSELCKSLLNPNNNV